jgi:hypothetical protein
LFNFEGTVFGINGVKIAKLGILQLFGKTIQIITLVPGAPSN